MNRNQLEWFCNACEARSFAKAAAASFVSRQAFGKAIKSLENELECTLFQRTEQGTVPTEAALRIYPIARQCVDGLRDMRRICDEYAPSKQRPVRIAIADGVVESVDESFFDELERMNDAYDIVIEKHFYAHCMDYLKDGRVDFAIAPGPVTDESFDSLPLAREVVTVIVSSDLVGFPVEDATPENLATIPFFSIGTGEQAMLGLDATFREHGLEFRRIDRYTEFGIVLRKAYAGVAAALAPESVMPRVAPGMVTIPLPLEQASWEPRCFWVPRSFSRAEEGVVEFMRAHAVSELDR